MGSRGISLTLLEDYLTNRKQLLKINELMSDALEVESGVLQGTNLSPCLFTLSINDIFEIYNDDIF